MQHLVAIQILRAFAAGMVVFQHAQNDAGRSAADMSVAFGRTFPLPWEAGVDLFFVVSGFVMVLSSEKLFAAPGGARRFLERRVARIVPLYWLSAVIVLAAVLRGAAAGKVLAPTLGEIVSSFAFIPWPRALDGAPRPIHSLGWTLEYEMFFYVVFASFVWLRREQAVAAVVAALGALVAWNWFATPQNVALAFWSDPIVLEFALGAGIALLYRRGLRLRPALAAALAALALVALALDGMDSGALIIDAVAPNGFPRLLCWGVPMAAIFAAATLGPSPADSPTVRALAKLGDASYALYLFHPLALIVLRKIWISAHLDAALGFWPLVATASLASIMLALAIHRWIEQPLTKAAQKLLAPRQTMARPQIAQG
jgi:exopolysaccharide production protein ExoZ